MNVFTFSNSFAGTNQVIRLSLQWAKDVGATLGAKQRNKTQTVQRIRWRRPTEPWVKINTDGAATRYKDHAGSGGVARDVKGTWLFGYSRNIGRCDATQAELWGILDGLTIAWSWQMQNIIVECDNQNVVNRLINVDEQDCNEQLVDSIREMLERSWNIKILHTYREANIVVDALAKRALNDPGGFRIFTEIPADISRAVKADHSSKSFKRNIAFRNM